MIRSFITFFLLLGSSLHSIIVETDTIHSVEKAIHPDTLILFDLDNTLIEPMQQLGSNQWFEHRIKELTEQTGNEAKSFQQALSEWEAIQYLTKVKEVEPGSVSLIHRLQKQGFTIMGLTSRGLGLSSRTLEQLDSIQVDFTLTAPTKDEIHFMNTRGVLLRGGVLFTAGTHKGQALMKLLNRLPGYTPTDVVFINDKKSHLIPVDESCEEVGLPFLGLRYGYLDEKVERFPADLCQIQFEAFGQIMSDEEAEALLR